MYACIIKVDLFFFFCRFYGSQFKMAAQKSGLGRTLQARQCWTPQTSKYAFMIKQLCQTGAKNQQDNLLVKMELLK